ncbi:cysteine synthase family protein [Vibrio aquimaris]|uniref:cysteine synthase n=1 Tax=Vibrio aquimaris TaxID=2587862 RepID=A0A5P9CRW2_9VIBR|nr:cysteine synthase family protein [Vibrio aquimaris]QFT28412.1 Cysteine synthase [Vibrio aquimaris]
MEIKDIGNTRLLELSRLNSNGNRVFAKCEFENPTGSHKDRTYLNIIESLEKQGQIKKGMTLIDCSTGNGGAALSWIASTKGYKVIVFMPEGMTKERHEQIRSFGGDIIETPKEKFLNGSVEAAISYAELNDNTYYLNQAGSLLNKEAWHTCGEEIVQSMKSLDLEPDYFVCSIGTGGTFSGITEVLKLHYPKIQTIGIEVDKSAPIYACRKGIEFTHKNHNLMGLGAGIISKNTEMDLIDELKLVDGRKSWSQMKEFIDQEQLGIGPTCGANLIVTKDICLNVEDKIIVTLFFDSSWKYKSLWHGNYPKYKI